jgi:hypothetical protein
VPARSITLFVLPAGGSSQPLNAPSNLTGSVSRTGLVTLRWFNTTTGGLSPYSNQVSVRVK